MTGRRTNRINARGATTTPTSKASDLKNKPDQFIECRIHHRWDMVGWFSWNDLSGSAMAHHSLCTRCGTTKDVYHRADGSVMDTRYDYPDGYLLHGEGRLKKKQVYRESADRATMYASPETMERAHKRRGLRAV